MMSRRYAGGKGFYAPSNTPSDQPQFVSCQRLPTPSTTAAIRRTAIELFQDACYYICYVCIVVFILGLMLQAVMYGSLQSPGGRSAAIGQSLTHYDILGVEPEADQDTITAGWRLQSATFHPDKAAGGNTEETRERYYWIQLAYVELSDPLARCYHDQYNGFLPRGWGGDDPCTKILMQREKKSRELAENTPDTVREEMLGKLVKDYGVSVNWLKVMRKKRDGREWKDAGWLKQKQLALLAAVEDYGQQVIAWKYVGVGFILTMIEHYWKYFIPLGNKYARGIRRRYAPLIAAVAEFWESSFTS
ncbi:hypothetical protein KVR01_009539 [Diaporthe batatas]|uniref:uncharacterized protein n=1 Tax=Diaporthe batatas TaxID=748121 RepID=UPI001D036AFD|nr:uncharacterized protein KVR01_009539 [Diaporthe batatas]KAG8161275.1 hypothetical protein KVR01_009539 [Diaporthe batatas]